MPSGCRKCKIKLSSDSWNLGQPYTIGRGSMNLKEEYDFLCDRIEDLKHQIKEAKDADISPMTIQLKYMKNYQSILKYRIEKLIDLDEC